MCELICCEGIWFLIVLKFEVGHTVSSYRILSDFLCLLELGGNPKYNHHYLVQKVHVRLTQHGTAEADPLLLAA